MGNVSVFIGDMHEQADRLCPAIEHVQGWLNTKMKTGRCSFGFIVDLAKHVVMNTLDVSAIYDEIAVLECPDARMTGTRGVKIFKHPPLAGLSYTHYFTTASLLKNLQNELSYAKTHEKYLRGKVGQITEEFVKELTRKVIIENFHRRSTDNRLTGEWLIFEESDAGNYYLTLACHLEDDNNIHARILQYKAVDAEIAKSSMVSAPEVP